MSVQKYFLYGFLNEDSLKAMGLTLRSRASAKIRGTLFCLPAGFPVYVADGDEAIQGMAVEFEQTSEAMQVLDRFHHFFAETPNRSYYIRSIAEVSGEFGADVAHVYGLALNKVPKGARRIPQGDWPRHRLENPALLEALSLDEQTLLRKIGARRSAGRTPVPLSIYRHFAALGLIVDNGRRLALTPLGREVYRFLL